MRRRVFLMTLAAVVTVALLSMLLVLKNVEQIQRETAAYRLLDTARVFAGSLESSAGDKEAEVQRWAAQLNSQRPEGQGLYRITLIEADGRVRLDTMVEPESLANHAGRTEFKEALADGEGWEIRYSDTLRAQMLYVAVELSDGSVARMAEPLSEVDLTRRAVAGAAIGSALAGLLMAGLLSAVLTKRILAPLQAMWKMTRHIRGGAYDQRLPEGSDELGRLAGDFNALSESLQHSMMDRQRAHAQLEGVLECAPVGILAVDTAKGVLWANSALRVLFDLPGKLEASGALEGFIRKSELWQIVEMTLLGKACERELEGERVLRVYTAPVRQEGSITGAVAAVQDITRMRKLEAMRTEFVSNVTHELKTPLTSLRGYVETLRTPLGEDAQIRREMLDIMDIQGERLELLIEDLLALAEIEHTQQAQPQASAELAPLFEDVAETLAPLAAAQQIELSASVKGDLWVRAQPERLRRIVLNLAENAIKYNRLGGHVVLCAQALEGRVRMTVQDDGIGIPPEHQGRIFERFYRVDKGRSRALGGTGLGLSIVKHLVRLYGGDIFFESEAGKGTVFTVDLPADVREKR